MVDPKGKTDAASHFVRQVTLADPVYLLLCNYV